MAAPTETIDSVGAAKPDERSPQARGGRRRIALPLAAVALLAAIVGALGPAGHVRTRYTWPPPAVPDARPARLWYTPLLLIGHQPEEISARIPCLLPTALRRATKPLKVLATARDPRTFPGLTVTRAGSGLSVKIG